MQGGILHTPWGIGGVLVRRERIVEVILPFLPSPDEIDRYLRGRGWCGEGSPLVQEVIGRIERYVWGELVPFSDLPLDEEGISPFARTVRSIVRQIPYGMVATYGAVAAASGSAGASRAVGRVMASNRTPLVVPCHRVVASDGSLCGFSAAGGVEAKRLMLAREGVLFRQNGGVDVDRHGGASSSFAQHDRAGEKSPELSGGYRQSSATSRYR